MLIVGYQFANIVFFEHMLGQRINHHKIMLGKRTKYSKNILEKRTNHSKNTLEKRTNHTNITLEKRTNHTNITQKGQKIENSVYVVCFASPPNLYGVSHYARDKKTAVELL